MELLLAQIARRCVRNAARARRVLVYATERSDAMGIASAHADLLFSGAVARAVVSRLDHHRRAGVVSAMAVAEIGLDLALALRLADGVGHPSGVMVAPASLSYHRPDVAETVRESDHVPKSAEPGGSDATTDRIRTIEARADV
ncbi:MAG: hypothetical protein F9K40_12020 [Kofleriaceae bacterium]|nr:MAG: hypothetical protein F9K40_12020 [Kofleriaceae bacterium]